MHSTIRKRSYSSAKVQFVLILRPFITAAQFVLGDVLVIFVMGTVRFIPFAFFVRGAASKRNPSST